MSVIKLEIAAHVKVYVIKQQIITFAKFLIYLKTLSLSAHKLPRPPTIKLRRGIWRVIYYKTPVVLGSLEP